MSDTLDYKEYSGSVEYSAKDEVFHGHVLGIRDRVTFEGNGREGVEEKLQGCGR